MKKYNIPENSDDYMDEDFEASPGLSSTSTLDNTQGMGDPIPASMDGTPGSGDLFPLMSLTHYRKLEKLKRKKKNPKDEDDFDGFEEVVE